MLSIPLGLSEKIHFVQKHKESAICAILREKTPFWAFLEAKKANWGSQLHVQRSKMHSIPLGPSEKKFLLCKSTKKARYVRSLGKKPHFRAFPEAKKANWRSQLYPQRSKMHSIPLRLSEKNSFCAKAQTKRDMCDPREKTQFWGLPIG